MYLLLFKIAVYLWIGSIGDTTEFQFAFHSKIMQNYIFEATNCRWIILIFSLFKVFFQLYHTITSPCICLSIVLGRLGEHSISWKPLSFALWFSTLISCSPNLPCVYIRLCKHGNHFTFLQYFFTKERKLFNLQSKGNSRNDHLMLK